LKYVIAFFLAFYFSFIALVFVDPLSTYNQGWQYKFLDWVKLFSWPISIWFCRGDK